MFVQEAMTMRSLAFQNGRTEEVQRRTSYDLTRHNLALGQSQTVPAFLVISACCGCSSKGTYSGLKE